MNIKSLLLAPVLSFTLSFAVAADEPASLPAPPDALTPEAEAIVEELRSSLPDDSEAIAMLDDILKGHPMGPRDGWFRLAVAQSRFEWDTIRRRYDVDDDAAISAEEFGGAQDFSRVDRDGDGLITESDLDWNEQSNKVAGTMFSVADQNGNGKITREEFALLFDALDSDSQGFLALDDFLGQSQPKSASAGDKRRGRPNRSMLVVGLHNQEIGSLQPGPALEDVAPDFTLKTLSGETVTLSEEIGDKPIVLIFGNFTCGPFRRQAGNLEKLYERYQDRAKFFLVYVREAHPSDGWAMSSNHRVGIDVVQPASDSDRRAVAQVCQNHLNLEIPFLVDTVDDAAGATYSGMPNRLYLIDLEGRIAFKNGRGPHGFHPRQLEQALVLLLATETASP